MALALAYLNWNKTYPKLMHAEDKTNITDGHNVKQMRLMVKILWSMNTISQIDKIENNI